MLWRCCKIMSASVASLISRRSCSSVSRVCLAVSSKHAARMNASSDDAVAAELNSRSHAASSLPRPKRTSINILLAVQQIRANGQQGSQVVDHDRMIMRRNSEILPCNGPADEETTATPWLLHDRALHSARRPLASQSRCSMELISKSTVRTGVICSQKAGEITLHHTRTTQARTIETNSCPFADLAFFL